MSTMSTTGNLVTIREAIQAHKNNHSGPGSPKNIFLDGSWHMPMGPSPRNGRSEYIAGPRIRNAFFFDIDDLSSPPPSQPSNPKNLPHNKPSPIKFAAAMDRMGISPEDTLYVYGTKGCAFYHRSYWTLASCGYHDPSKVKLIMGSLDEWKECGGELENEVLNEDDARLFRMSDVNLEKANQTTKYACWKKDDEVMDSSVVDLNQVLAIVNDKNKESHAKDAIIIDARSSGRFYGRDPEPRPGLRGGHMPGALNLPFVSLLDPDDPTKFRSMDEVRDAFVKAGIAPLSEDKEGGGEGQQRKVICTCGSGVTAAALAVGLEECGLRSKDDIYIYDGSWIDWGSEDDTPIVTED